LTLPHNYIRNDFKNIDFMIIYLFYIFSKLFKVCLTFLYYTQDARIDLSDLNIQMGKPVSVIRNTKFCVDLLIDYNNRARSLFTIPTEDSIKRRE